MCENRRSALTCSRSYVWIYCYKELESVHVSEPRDLGRGRFGESIEYVDGYSNVKETVAIFGGRNWATCVSRSDLGLKFFIFLTCHVPRRL